MATATDILPMAMDTLIVDTATDTDTLIMGTDIMDGVMVATTHLITMAIVMDGTTDIITEADIIFPPPTAITMITAGSIIHTDTGIHVRDTAHTVPVQSRIQKRI